MHHHNTDINSGSVARYCKRSSLDDETKLPTSSAFQRRLNRNEDYLSIYLLDFFADLQSESEQIQATKLYMENRGWQCSRSALFAILDIARTKSYIFEEISEYIDFQEAGLPHCGIFHDADDLLISELLAECVQATYSVINL